MLYTPGFFHHAAVTSRNAYAWECYAVCNFLVYNDFNSSFDAFIEAFKYGKLNKKLQVIYMWDDVLLEIFCVAE